MSNFDDLVNKQLEEQAALKNVVDQVKTWWPNAMERDKYELKAELEELGVFSSCDCEESNVLGAIVPMSGLRLGRLDVSATASEAGGKLWMLQLRNGREASLFADEATIVDGAVVFTGKVKDSTTVLLAIPAGEWASFYAASHVDAWPLCIADVQSSLDVGERRDVSAVNAPFSAHLGGEE
ncbi:MAG: hypothetical protein EBR82_81265 [Caulobacteraceae bacterium]|nr:hypothetical protein [Caulobacteraceae bacterium]